MPPEHTRTALAILRNPGLFQENAIPQPAIVLFMYSSQTRKRCWNALYVSLAFRRLSNGPRRRAAPRWQVVRPGGTLE